MHHTTSGYFYVAYAHRFTEVSERTSQKSSIWRWTTGKTLRSSSWWTSGTEGRSSNTREGSPHATDCRGKAIITFKYCWSNSFELSTSDASLQARNRCQTLHLADLKTIWWKGVKKITNTIRGNSSWARLTTPFAITLMKRKVPKQY